MFVLEEGQHRFTDVQVLDEPGAGGAHHEYQVVGGVQSPNDWPKPIYAKVSFQRGPVAESGQNGLFMEDLLQIVAHRLACFQAGDFACCENALALTKVQEALHWLNHRTANRQARGVEGTSKQ